MVDCAYCERPLVCDECRAAFVPKSAEGYEGLSRSDYIVYCSSCGEVLVCRWCKTPYNGGAEDEDATDS